MQQPRPWPLDAPELKSSKVTLFVVIDGIPWYGKKVSEKRDLLEQTGEEPVWGTWRGEYSTDVFAIDRAQAELEVCTGPDRSRSVDPGVEALLAWFGDEAGRQGFRVDYVSHAAAEVSAAKRLLAGAPKGRIAAVAQHALTTDKHREWVHSVAALDRQWNRLLASWEAAGAPAYDREYVYEGAADGTAAG